MINTEQKDRHWMGKWISKQVDRTGCDSDYNVDRFGLTSMLQHTHMNTHTEHNACHCNEKRSTQYNRTCTKAVVVICSIKNIYRMGRTFQNLNK